MTEEGTRGRRTIVEEALSALKRQRETSQVPGAVVESTLRAVSELAQARPASHWKERILSMWRKEARVGGSGSTSGTSGASGGIGTGGTGPKGAQADSQPPPGHRPIGRFAVAAAALLALNAAGIIWIHHDLLAKAHQKIRVLSTLPAGQVDEADRFALIFDEPVVSPAEVGKPLERHPYILSPQPAGQWQWAATDRLEFVLARKLPAGQVFTLKPAAEMESLTGRQVVGPAEFRFYTRALVLQSCLLEGRDKESVHFSLRFNQPVHPSDLMKRISVRDANNNADLKPVSLTQEASDRIVLRADRPACGTLKVQVRAGLTGVGGQLALGNDVFESLTLPDRFSLLRAEVETPGLGEVIAVDLNFSQALGGLGDLPRISVSPAVEGNVSRLIPEAFGSSSRLRVVGRFECGKRYTVTVPGTLQSASGGTLGEEQSVSFDVPNREPGLSFAASRGILSPAGNMVLDLEAVNVHQVNLSASRIHANNLVDYLHGQRHLDRVARDLPTKTVNLDLPPNVPGKLAVDLKGLVDQSTGVYRVTASLADPENCWTNDSAVVAVTDLAITAKRHKDGYLVWVTSIATGKPVGGAAVRAITYNNQTVGEAQTDEDGTALLAASFEGPDGPAWIITAEKERDLSFLQVDKNRPQWDDRFELLDYRPGLLGDRAISEWEIGARPRPKTYEVMLYGERGIYRPGEAIHMTGIVRDAHGAVPPPFPVSVRVTRPDGREVAHLPVTMDFPGQGMFHADYVSPADGQTGEYTFTASLPGAKETLGWAGVLVEAFVPVRLEVKASPSKPRYEAADDIEANVSARYLFGQPGAGLPYRVMGAYHPVPFTSDKFKDYTFDQNLGRRNIEAVMGAEGKLDDAGAARATLFVPPNAKSGLWRADMTASVTEPGGRSVSAGFSYLLDMDEVHIGLRVPPSRIAPVDAPVKFDWVRLRPDGELVAGESGPAQDNESPLAYELSRVEWDWVAEQVNGEPVWKSKERLIPVSKGAIEATGAKGSLSLRCPQAGRYQLVVRAAADADSEEANAASAEPTPAPAPIGHLKGRRHRSAPVQADRAEPSRPATVVEFFASDAKQPTGTLVEQPQKVEVVLDRARYVPGSVAKALVRSPFPGTLLLTVETDRVIDRQVMEMTGKTAEIELPVPFDLRGGAFVSATVVRAVDPQREKWLPARASGLAHLVTDHANRTVPLSLDAPAKVRQGQKIHVTARAGCAVNPANPPVVHLWAVDEGILLCTDYRTPAPLGFFLAQRRHEVLSADLFNELLPDYKRPADIRKIGAGGDDADREARRSVLPIRTTQAAVVWHKAIPLGPDGTLSADLELPACAEPGRGAYSEPGRASEGGRPSDFTGELRLMAVAVDGDCYGSAQTPVTVASPLVVEASWPRFASPGDKFQVPVKLFNSTGDRVTVQLSLRVTGPVSAGLASAAVENGAEIARAPHQVAGKQDTDPARGATLGDALDLGEIELLPGKPKTLWLNAQADAMGQVSADVIASPTGPAMPEVPPSRSHSECTIRPAATLHSIARLIVLKAGEGLELKTGDDFLPGTLRRIIEVSGQPNVQLRPAVEELLDYPYGCVEQTTSRLYGILYAPDLLLLETPLPPGEGRVRASDGRVEEAGRMIRAGILRLWSMQTRTGGMAYWPGGTADCLWPSAYVGGFLAEARRNGYAVEKEFSDKLCDYLLRNLGNTSQELPDNLRAEICRVLAAFGRPQQGWMNRLSEKVDDLDMGGRANLAAAFALAGRKDLALKVLPEGTIGLLVSTATGGRITSQTAQHAALLGALMDLQPDHPWTGLLADRLNKGRVATGRWGTTLENAMCIAALAKYQTARKQKSEFTGSLKVEGGETFAFDSNRPARIKLAGDKTATIETAGAGPVYLNVKEEGLAKEPPKPYDRGLVVRRRWTDLAGHEIDPAKVRVGDLIAAEVYFRAPDLGGDSIIENVAIVDALPGGVEVENTRLAVSAKIAPSLAVSPVPLAVSRPAGNSPASNIATASAPALAASAPVPLWSLPEVFRSAQPHNIDRVEWLDDRVVIFTSVFSRPGVYRYLLRATCAGRFVLPQLQASCMYDPALASVSEGGEVTVAK